MNKLLEYFLSNVENKTKEENEIILDWMRLENKQFLIEKDLSFALSFKQKIKEVTFFYMDPFLIEDFFKIQKDGLNSSIKFIIKKKIFIGKKSKKLNKKPYYLDIKDKNHLTSYKYFYTCMSCGYVSKNKLLKDFYKVLLSEGIVCKNCKRSIIFQTDVYKNKYSKTMNNLYGCSYPIQNENIKNSIKKTCLEKYNCETPFNNGILRDKARLTMIKKYGKLAVLHGKRNKGPASSIIENNFIEEFLKEYGKQFLIEDNDIYCNLLNKQYFINTTSERKWLDLYIKSKKIAIQIHGDFWHGNLSSFLPEKIHPIFKKTFKEVYEESLEADKEIFKSEKINLYIVIWSKSIYKNMHETIRKVINIIKDKLNGSFYI
jgi:hypothetical protein